MSRAWTNFLGDPDIQVEFIRQLREIVTSSQGPIVVHSTAGRKYFYAYLLLHNQHIISAKSGKSIKTPDFFVPATIGRCGIFMMLDWGFTVRPKSYKNKLF